MGTPVDLDFALAGYLRSPDGRHLRHVIGLDAMARDALMLGACITWGDPPSGQAGYCLWRRRHIVLARWLYWCSPWLLRDVLSHELGHVAAGPSETRAHHWQAHHYGDVIRPPLAWIA